MTGILNLHTFNSRAHIATKSRRNKLCSTNNKECKWQTRIVLALRVLLAVFSSSFDLFCLNVINPTVHSPKFRQIRAVLSISIYICYIISLRRRLCSVMLLCLRLSAFKGWTTFYFMFPNLFAPLIYYECLCIKWNKEEAEKYVRTAWRVRTREEIPMSKAEVVVDFFFHKFNYATLARQNLDKELLLYHRVQQFQSVCNTREWRKIWILNATAATIKTSLPLLHPYV